MIGSGVGELNGGVNEFDVLVEFIGDDWFWSYGNHADL